jgi:hypothetical protein
MSRLHIDGGSMATLERHLRTGPDEQLAFLLARWDGDDARVFELRLVEPSRFDVQLPWHLTLGDEERGAVIKWAHDAGGALVEVHAHLAGDPAAFSSADRAGLDQFVPHVWWRLGRRPYVALVVADTTFDAVVWRSGPEVPEALEALVIDGREERRPTGLTLRQSHR